nr:Bcp-type thiol peroxidase [uncultured bacterium]QLG20469.1 Bcp-type thiol peroxidase [uncultured bacterium]QLG20512.1 Bcp-type thiol peroxidase [uncultured bacterium]
MLYFYPKDNTPGCTTQAQQFRDLHGEFVKSGCVVMGVSRDSLKSHENFKAKFGLPFELIADTQSSLCHLFDVIKNKMMYGKKVVGIERSTFLINADGVLCHEWRGTKADGNAAAVLEKVNRL